MLAPSIFRDNFVDDFFSNMFYPSSHTVEMNTDIKEFNDKYELHLQLPGFKKEDIQAELKDGYLTIHASHKENKEEKDDAGHYIRRECYSGHCNRSFYVGENITEDDIKAEFTDGILKLDVPKKEEVPAQENTRYIEIK